MERKGNTVLRTRRKKQVSSHCGITVRETDPEMSRQKKGVGL